jgi:hypothetical protein
MKANQTRARKIIDALYSRNSTEVDQCSSYGEPGYTNPEQSILFANWNQVPERVQNYLEQAGFELEWSDEWYIDRDNDKAWRTSPNGYDWSCSVHYADGYVLTPDDDVTEWISEMEDAPDKALPEWVSESDLVDNGYRKHNGDDYENGLHPGQNDNPRTIYKELQSIGNVVFRFTEHSQFYVKFDVWVKGETV